MILKRLMNQGCVSAALVALGLAMAPAGAQAEDGITFTSWTGPYMRSQMLGFVRPYEDATGIRVDVEHYSGGINEIRDQVESANVVWDVVDLTQADSLRACNEGLLENLSDVILPPGADGTPYREDFVDGALNECGVGVIIWATAFAHSLTAFDSGVPSTISDFFDTNKFPGRRAIRRDPSVIMEWALMADGVARGDVYSTLETDAGVERALGVMDSIKSGLQLWSNGGEPARMLNDGDVTVSMIWATTGAALSAKPGSDFAMVWDGRVLELDLFGIPKGSRNKQAAIDFIRHASSSESLAKMVEYLPNGPTRKSSLGLLSNKVLGQLPNNPAHGGAFIRSDAQWWSNNHARLEEAFEAWLTTVSQQGASGTVR